MTNKITVQTAAELIELGEKLGALLGGGEVIELAGDISAGKTTFTKGVARGMKITDEVGHEHVTMAEGADTLAVVEAVLTSASENRVVGL